MDAGVSEVTTHPVPDDHRGHAPALLAGLGLVATEPAPLAAHLLDSFDARLAAADLEMIAVEAVGARSGTQPGPVRVTVADARGGVVGVVLDRVPRTADALPPGPLRDRLAEHLGGRALVTLVTLDGTVRTWRSLDEHGRSEVEAVEWTEVGVVPGVHAVPSQRSMAIDPTGCPGSILEVRAGQCAAAASRVRAVLSVSGLDGHARSGPALLADLAGIDRRGRTSRSEVDLDPSMPAIDGYREVLSALLETIRATRTGAAEALDPEFLHDLRVAVRRTRSVLRHGRRVLPDEVRDRARDGFGRLSTLTGHARDLDVQVLDLPDLTIGFDTETQCALEPLIAHLAAEREAAHEFVRAGLADPSTDELLRWWQEWLEGGLEGTDDLPGRAHRPLATVVADELQRAQRRLLRDARAIDDLSPAEHLHQLRKDAKALRYLFECFAPILPGRPRKRFVRRLKSFQDLLGAHQDAEVHGHLLTDMARQLSRECVGHDPIGVDTFVAIGRLVEIHDRRRAEMRTRFGLEFAAYDDRSTHRAVEAVIARLRSRHPSRS